LKTARQEPDLTIELVEGDRGVFDVRADGRLIFSKKTVGRFPSAADILTRL
jgi:selT/selW/selH-like putative selenoprotein